MKHNAAILKRISTIWSTSRCQKSSRKLFAILYLDHVSSGGYRNSLVKVFIQNGSILSCTI